MHINSRRDKRNIKSKRIRNTVTIELSMYCSILQIKLLRVLAVHVHPFIEGKVVSHYGSIVLHYYHQAYFPFLTQIKCLYMCSLLWVFSKKCTEELRNKKCTHLSVDSSLFFWKTTLRLYNNMFNKMDSQWKGRIPKKRLQWWWWWRRNGRIYLDITPDGLLLQASMGAKWLLLILLLF